MRVFPRVVFLTLLLIMLLPLTAAGWKRGEVERFATLPPGFAHPEGITVDDDGRVYVTTFDVTQPVGSLGQLFVFDRRGELRRRVSVANSSNLLLDLAFHPKTGALLIIDFGKQQVLRVNPFTGASSVFTTIPGGASAGPNVLTFDNLGNVYISDSFQATIWRTGPTGAPTATLWKTHDLLGTSGVPPFGANGLAFNNDQSALFVANTGNDTIVKIPVTSSTAGPMAGTPEVFVNSINGADGLIIDRHDNLWVAANQADEIVVVNPEGRVIAKLGDFDGLDDDGRPRGLLFPASLVRHGHFIYVTNLSLNLRAAVGAGFQTVDSPWAAEVTRHTIARIKARIPPISGLSDDEE